MRMDRRKVYPDWRGLDGAGSGIGTPRTCRGRIRGLVVLLLRLWALLVLRRLRCGRGVLLGRGCLSSSMRRAASYARALWRTARHFLRGGRGAFLLGIGSVGRMGCPIGQ